MVASSKISKPDNLGVKNLRFQNFLSDMQDLKTKVMEPLTAKCSKLITEMAKKDDLKLLKSEMKTVRENLNKALEKENQKKIEKEDENAETLSSVRTKIEKLESKPPVLTLTISDLTSWSRARILEIFGNLA